MQGVKRVLSYARRAIDDYGMISDGDMIGIGVSGGKDSVTLLVALSELRRFYPAKFDICAIIVDLGFENTDYSEVMRFCADLGVPCHLEKTEIGRIVFDMRKEKNPCSLCANMRRGALNNAAKRYGCDRVALGHHFDDVIETFMLNLSFEGRLSVFQPVTHLTRRDLFVIRPLIYMPEKEITGFVKKAKLPTVKSACKADGKTKREEIKNLLSELERKHRGLKQNIFDAILSAELDGFKRT